MQTKKPILAKINEMKAELTLLAIVVFIGTAA